MTLPEDFIARQRLILGDEFEEFLKSYSLPAQRAIRVNTLKISVEEFLKISPFALEPVAAEPSGFFTESDGLGKTVLHAAGAYYVQEPSAMHVVPELKITPGEKVLDLCSAPGGKGTQAAQYLKGEGLIILNEINFPRAKILSGNVERLGIKNAVVTCAPPEQIAQNLPEYFDKIIVDAPCSGEGMFKKEPNAIPEWSLQNVLRCAERQRGILSSAAAALKAGGRLIYSTCTFAPEEDEEQVQAFLNAFPAFKLLKMQKLYPHKIRGEGHFFALFEKLKGNSFLAKPLNPSAKKEEERAYISWCEENGVKKNNALSSFGGALYSLPCDTPQLSVQILRAGVKLGEVQKGRFLPDHALAMSLTPAECKTLPLTQQDALSYLRGSTIACESSLSGWLVATYKNLPLGWVKAVNGVAKNHLPKGIRI